MKPKKFCWKEFFKLFGKELLLYITIYIIAAMMLTRAFFERWVISCIITVCGTPIFLLEIKKYLSARRQARIETEFFKSQSVRADSAALRLEIFCRYSGIKQIQFAVLFNRRAGKTAAGILVMRIGHKRRA